MFFYDFLYSAKSKVVIEEHIIRTTFLGKETKIHERIKDSLLKVEQKIYAAAKTNKEIQDFIENLKSADAYNWRIIEGTGGRKSFHSYGIAIDLLPKRLGGKEIFWSWARDKNPKTWMLTPLSARWMPPQKVIDFFEEEGFIWGGNWIIFDNMHFEYHPELLNQN
ncbi:M15 family metallopeptidase [Treponema pectinovorum]|uniref:M15 family metallopeptidase n=1 Tax=Treponema pectinovorum TaxID=164 RepID=UPI0011CB9958|nr:M15 family metallopeptidase [Treponema pectinovorum]